MIYLDNAATSFPKPVEVYDRMNLFIRETCANPGRSSHEMARASASWVMKAREVGAQLFNIENPLRIGFTPNATYALNMAIQGVSGKSIGLENLKAPLITLYLSRSISILSFEDILK